MGNKKCDYCNKELITKLNYCSEDCKKAVKRYESFENKYKKIFFVLMVMGILINFIGALLFSFNENLGFDIVAIGIIILGLNFIFLPFVIVEIFRDLGLKKVKILIRLMGVIIFVIGLICTLI